MAAVSRTGFSVGQPPREEVAERGRRSDVRNVDDRIEDMRRHLSSKNSEYRARVRVTVTQLARQRQGLLQRQLLPNVNPQEKSILDMSISLNDTEIKMLNTLSEIKNKVETQENNEDIWDLTNINPSIAEPFKLAKKAFNTNKKLLYATCFFPFFSTIIDYRNQTNLEGVRRIFNFLNYATKNMLAFAKIQAGIFQGSRASQISYEGITRSFIDTYREMYDDSSGENEDRILILAAYSMFVNENSPTLDFVDEVVHSLCDLAAAPAEEIARLELQRMRNSYGSQQQGQGSSQLLHPQALRSPVNPQLIQRIQQQQQLPLQEQLQQLSRETLQGYLQQQQQQLPLQRQPQQQQQQLPLQGPQQQQQQPPLQRQPQQQQLPLQEQLQQLSRQTLQGYLQQQNQPLPIDFPAAESSAILNRARVKSAMDELAEAAIRRLEQSKQPQ